MKNLIEFLKGKKTYFAAAALFIVGGLEAIGVISAEVAGPVKTFLAAAGLAALRASK